VEVIEDAAADFGPGTTLLDQFAQDPNATKRVGNIYWPFESADEWEIAVALDRLGVSQCKMKLLLETKLVCSQASYMTMPTHSNLDEIPRPFV
jgi:hypothetical protein